MTVWEQCTAPSRTFMFERGDRSTSRRGRSWTLRFRRTFHISASGIVEMSEIPSAQTPSTVLVQRLKEGLRADPTIKCLLH